MKLLIVVLFVSVFAAAQGQRGYDLQKFSNINIDAILSNDRVLKGYLNCMLDKGSCSPEGREMKKHFPEVYNSNCSKCSEDQKVLVKKYVPYFIKRKPADWEEVITKYDPEHKHNKEFEKWLNEK